MLQINTLDELILNGQLTNYKAIQRSDGTHVYRQDGFVRTEIEMPKARYALSTNAGMADFEKDLF